MILVTGATGYVGGRLVPRLLERGYEVRCLARDASRLINRWNRAEIFQGDVLDEESLNKALEGIDTAYYLIHSMGGDGEFSKTAKFTPITTNIAIITPVKASPATNPAVNN